MNNGKLYITMLFVLLSLNSQLLTLSIDMVYNEISM